VGKKYELPKDRRFTYSWVNPIAWTTRMKKYQKPHAKAIAKVHADISQSSAAPTAFAAAAAEGVSRGQIVMRRQI
jgi:hypothetical protein